ncbi:MULTISPECIES: DUF2087 domain-containing protein [Deinococcus]|jgi:Uncharacterized protein conserved in bacteria|uniref:DUF2087 domain-containing protein n=1 Tax=Deinococcus radiodurans (strain ATCC 13939 / DSM 20539 / JCM 16871 / CCUG 27074 / LMG 4051 / NBRC 15346 / NCIMB 9279 / VKM B-1422 / R1) TaxID=243230 RepID=Q9RVC5_DEIRA|nr:DUF2087 domain-containing protein [Deinococcus radiodurans]AAF10680.1 hypothetical protein DR_1104 [Deinococcus radiodurans R1 = ATCC 13939 = DSM 20539]ANC71717.1 hypothetical protein A2G07_08000 [Deinococcus radiodurans R1 = ATCC 13939 = DSM 20539]QEM70589.1 DUF2087 domain-containing protein [Deinococcus radiodurans]QIP29192.1 DUF2087 domain-containing protein [Deinococcus radiodurans]QIP32112.1 DUF2087 domain-containing protein [Deinococcus radiodurans]
MTKSIADFQDEHGRVTGWPSDRRRAHQLAILDHLKNLFESGAGYSREQVIQLLSDHTTLEDPALLLRELLEGDYLTGDGDVFWRADGRPAAGRSS